MEEERMEEYDAFADPEDILYMMFNAVDEEDLEMMMEANM